MADLSQFILLNKESIPEKINKIKMHDYNTFRFKSESSTGIYIHNIYIYNPKQIKDNNALFSNSNNR